MGVKNLLQSTIPGLKYLPSRSNAIPFADSYLEGRRYIDGAEYLWRINDCLYDFEKFIAVHPGGAEWISLTKGTDITELFESHHLSKKASNILPIYYIRDAVTPRSVPMTFKEDGFYKTFKKQALSALKNVDYHKPSSKTNFVSDSLAMMALFFCLISAATQSPIVLLTAGLLVTWTTISGHNYFHMRENFRMYYFDISLMSSRDWRITHAMSHHMYPNTLWDYEMYAFEPYLQWLPKSKSLIARFGWLYSPIIWFLAFYLQGISRYITVLFGKRRLEFRDLVPFIIPMLMSFVAPNISIAIKNWIIIIGISSMIFQFIAINSAHHHPGIFHDGDICRNELDWGLLEIDAVRDRKIIDDFHFLTLTSFGLHTLHHLLPTVDHAYLPLCFPAFEATCREFNLNIESLTQFEMIKGQFKQLARIKPERNHR